MSVAVHIKPECSGGTGVFLHHSSYCCGKVLILFRDLKRGQAHKQNVSWVSELRGDFLGPIHYWASSAQKRMLRHKIWYSSGWWVPGRYWLTGGQIKTCRLAWMLGNIVKLYKHISIKDKTNKIEKQRIFISKYHVKLLFQNIPPACHVFTKTFYAHLFKTINLFRLMYAVVLIHKLWYK